MIQHIERLLVTVVNVIVCIPDVKLLTVSRGVPLYWILTADFEFL